MGGQTNKTHHQKTPEGSEENSQTKTKADIGQRLEEGSVSELMSLRLSKKKGRRHAPAQQGDRGEGKVEEKEMGEPGSSEKPLSGAHEVTDKTDPIRNGFGAGTPFDIDDVNAGVAILTRITDVCKRGGEPSIQERQQLRDLFRQMPYLLTQEAREQQGEEVVSALQFLVTVYDNPESTNWGAIESFDHLQLVLETMEKFGSRAEAEPRKGRGGVFIV